MTKPLRILSTSVSLVVLTCFVPFVARAQDSATDLGDVYFNPRMGVGYRDSNAGEDSGFSYVTGFLPLVQIPGQDLFFLQGQFRRHEDARLGAGLLLGYRHLLADKTNILGSYLAFDYRDGDGGSFNQLGAGVEMLNPGWQVRLNGYLPVGNRSNTLDQVAVNQTQITNSQFQGNHLSLTQRRDLGEIRLNENSVSGLDLEAGLPLLSFGNGGKLWAYGGSYLYSVPNNSSYVGWRLRLNAQPWSNINLGLSIQGDGLFDTRVGFSVSSSFGSPLRALWAAEDGQDANFYTQMASADFDRTNAIVVAQQQVADITTTEETGPAINPITGEPWVFSHVALGASEAGSGEFGSEFGTFDEALTALETAGINGNQIIYVDFGDGSVIPGDFILPGGVQLLSQGPTQTLITTIDPAVTLPLSGDGFYPSIDGSVFVETSDLGLTALSGFAIDGAEGVFVPNITGDLLIANNQITAENFGVLAYSYVEGSIEDDVTITNNTIDLDGGEGFFVGIALSTFDSDLGVITLDDNQIAIGTIDGGEGIGIGVSLEGDAKDTPITVESVSISGNTINIASHPYISYSNNIQAIGLETSYMTLGPVTISGNTVNITDPTEGGELGNENIAGIIWQDYASELTGEVSITGNTVTIDTNSYSSYSQGISLDLEQTQSVHNLTINGNTIDGGEGIGIHVDLQDVSMAAVIIEGNQVTLPDGEGIAVHNDGASTLSGDLTLMSNVVNAGNDGIEIGNDDATLTGNITVTGNTVTSTNNDGIYIYNYDGATLNGEVTVTGNTITADDDGVDIYNDGTIERNVTVTGNTITAGDQPIEGPNGTVNGTITTTPNP